METKRVTFRPNANIMRSYVGFLETNADILVALNSITLGTGTGNRIGARIKISSIVIHYKVFCN